jgi:glycosyltransferase involved in cell wall biosynthesis
MRAQPSELQALLWRETTYTGTRVRICIVAYIVPAHGIGGMQDHTRDLATGLVRAGHEVDVITSRHPEGGRREEIVDGVRYVFVDAPRNKYDHDWRRESHSEFVRREAERPFDVLHSESSSAVELFRRGIHRRVPFVVMIHGALLGLAKAQLKSALRTRRPVPLLRAIRGVQWLATNEHFRHGNWYRFRAVETIVPSRQQVKDTRRSCLLKESRVHVVPNGIDAELFRPRPIVDARARLGLGGGPIFAAVGRLSSDKGFHHAVQALALLNGDASDAQLVIVGEGPERQRLERLSRRLGVEKQVVFAGAQPHEGVSHHLAAADAFLFPTERDEAAPLVLPQAMACARPVVASRTGGITEVIGESGEYGVLVPPGDAAALAREMNTLLSDPSLRRRLGQAARRRVLAEYTIERMVERTVDVYRIAVARLDQEAAASSPNGSSAPIPRPTRRAT